ncbi:MAG TPA: glycosyltransferase family 4 protein [Candidatus Bathyarchaeia archaeon]
MSGFGGMATSSECLCSELAKLGVNITVITTEATGPLPSESRSQVQRHDERLFRTIRLPVAGRAFERFTGIYYTRGFHAAYRKQAAAADIVHFHGFRSYQNFAAARATRKCQKKYILQPHGSSVRGYGKGVMKIIYDYVVGIRQALSADALIASTQIEALQLENLGVDSGKIHTIPNGVYRESWTRSPKSPTLFRDSLHIERDAPIVLFVGRLDSTKGLDLLVESFGPVVEKTPDAMLVLVGPDFGMQSRLEILVRRTGLKNRVVFAGPANYETVHSAYMESKVVVIPSTYESFGLVALEAAAAGTPVVMTEACGLAATFRSAGLTVVTGDRRSLSKAISRFVQDKAFRDTQRVALDRLPWERFTWREVASAVLAIYEDASRS